MVATARARPAAWAWAWIALGRRRRRRRGMARRAGPRPSFIMTDVKTVLAWRARDRGACSIQAESRRRGVAVRPSPPATVLVQSKAPRPAGAGEGRCKFGAFAVPSASSSKLRRHKAGRLGGAP